MQNLRRSREELSQDRVVFACFPEEENSLQRSTPNSAPLGRTSRTVPHMGRALHLCTTPPLSSAGGDRHSPHASQLCSCRGSQTCSMRPEAPRPHQFRTRLTAAHPASPIALCSPTQKVASCPRPARISQLAARSQVSVSNNRNPAAPPPRWCSGGNLSSGIFLTRIEKLGPFGAFLWR